MCVTIDAVAMEPGAFIDLDDIALPEAADFVARLTGYSIELGPGAGARITMSSPRALTYVDVLEAFDKELARNGMTAIKRGHAMLIVPATQSLPGQLLTRQHSAEQKAHMALPSAPKLASLKFQAYVSNRRQRIDALVQKLTGAGVAASVVKLEEDGDTAYALLIETVNSDASMLSLRSVIAKLDLGELLTLPPR
jgi:hypothetical protein